MRIGRKDGIYLLYRLYGCRERASVVAAVEGVEKCSVLCYHCSLRCGGAGIYSEIAVAGVAFKTAFDNAVAVMACAEFLVGILRGEQRLHTLYLKVHLNLIVKLGDESVNINGNLIFGGHCRTYSRKKM